MAAPSFGQNIEGAIFLGVFPFLGQMLAVFASFFPVFQGFCELWAPLPQVPKHRRIGCFLGILEQQEQLLFTQG